MREIKFRAWNKIDKEMVFTPMIIPKREGGGYAVTGDGHRYELMQYTGLKDKKGIEIYEGDICRSKDLIDSIKWERCGWKFWVEDCLDCYNNSSDLKLEIIGNIYENPELLK